MLTIRYLLLPVDQRTEANKEYAGKKRTHRGGTLDWDQKVVFTQLLLERLRSMGGEFLENERASRFADYASELLSMYVGEVTRYRNWLRQP